MKDKTKEEYPTWTKTTYGWRSLEERGGHPDFTLEHLGTSNWWLKWRTSEGGEEFSSASEAKRSLKERMANGR
jgi:hypothetical protein